MGAGLPDWYRQGRLAGPLLLAATATGRPWRTAVYYYLLLLPLYEQLAIVFGIGGAVYSALPADALPSLPGLVVCRLAGLYSWAGEKMPWLSIHILLPLMLLAAIMIERLIEACIDLSWDVRLQGRASCYCARRNRCNWPLRQVSRRAAEVTQPQSQTDSPNPMLTVKTNWSMNRLQRSPRNPPAVLYFRPSDSYGARLAARFSVRIGRLPGAPLERLRRRRWRWRSSFRWFIAWSSLPMLNRRMVRTR